jgi:hypothetical protein
MVAERRLLKLSALFLQAVRLLPLTNQEASVQWGNERPKFAKSLDCN